MIRTFFAALFAVLFLLISYPIFLVEWMIGKFDKQKKDYSCLRVIQWAIRVVFWISGTKLTVIGKENIPDEAALYVANHRGIFDIMVMYANCKRITGFVAKKELQKIPSLRVWMKHIYCLFLDRNDIKDGMRVILQAIDYVKQGISIGIFPEGTRNTGEELSILPFKEGSFKIALKTGCPIVPVAINNTAAAFENHAPWIKKTHITVEYKAPIYPKDLSKDEQKVIGATCQQIIEETIRKNA